MSKANVRNPDNTVGYVKSIYFAYLIMKKYNLFDKSILEAKDNLLSVLNPRFAKDKAQELKLIALENKVDNILNMLSNVIQKKGEE